jgi:hypothetical protein
LTGTSCDLFACEASFFGLLCAWREVQILRQQNYRAIRIIKSSLTSEEYDKVDGLKSAKEVWDTLFINHEGTKQVREVRI